MEDVVRRPLFETSGARSFKALFSENLLFAPFPDDSEIVTWV